MPSKHEAAALGVWNDSAKNRVLAKRSKEARKRLLTNIYFWTSVIETHVVLWAYVHGLRSSLMLGVVLASILALFGAFQLRRRRGHPVDNHDLALFENVDDADYCLVDLEIWMSTKRIGVDRGVCWFEDNCLMFCGYNCSFSLGGQDVVKPSMLRLYLMISEFGNRRDSALPLLSHDGKPWITLTAIDSGRHVTWTALRRFKKNFEVFKNNPPETNRPRQYPPLKPLDE